MGVIWFYLVGVKWPETISGLFGPIKYCLVAHITGGVVGGTVRLRVMIQLSRGKDPLSRL